MAIQEFPYQLDVDSLEIFPETISRDNYVLFHGTSEYHSNDIENNGFIRGKSPFDLNAAIELHTFLDRPDIKPFDIPNRYGQTCYSGLGGYIFGIKNDQIRISFSHLSYGCVPFAFGNLKGGQSLNHINEARSIIENAIQVNPKIQAELGPTILNLFAKIQEIQNARGVVYAVKFPNSLDGLEMGTGVIHSNLAIPKGNIIGKMFIPTNINVSVITPQVISAKHQDKLYRYPDGLAILIDKKNNPETEDDLEMK